MSPVARSGALQVRKSVEERERERGKQVEDVIYLASLSLSLHLLAENNAV